MTPEQEQTEFRLRPPYIYDPKPSPDMHQTLVQGFLRMPKRPELGIVLKSHDVVRLGTRQDAWYDVTYYRIPFTGTLQGDARAIGNAFYQLTTFMNQGKSSPWALERIDAEGQCVYITNSYAIGD